MKIIINTASTYKGGGVQVARSLIEECKNFTEHEYHVVLGDMLASQIEVNKYPENFSFSTIAYRPATRVLGFASPDKDLKKIEERVHPDVVFTTSGPAYWRPKVPHLVGYNLPHYVYRDSSFFSQVSLYQRLKWDLKGRFVMRYFRRDADAYVVQTEDVNQRLRKLLHTDRVYTVSNTHSNFYTDPKEVPNKLPCKKDGEFRFLTLSAWHTHKNLKILSDVIEKMPDTIKSRTRFILTLSDDEFRDNFSAAAKAYITNIGPIKPDEGPALYKECDALFLPTLLECFSASYAEAMKMEKPILTSDLGFAHSVCGDAALYFDPINPSEIAEKIGMVIDNPKLRNQLIQRGRIQQRTFLTAEERTAEYLKICKELVDGTRN